MKPTISLCMVVKNEELLLRQCLNSVKGVVDEIVVVDTGSTDRTVEIARKFGARVIPYRWEGSFSKARNESIKRAGGSWILVLDADERIARRDIPKLKKLIEQSVFSAYYLPVRNYTNAYDLLWQWYPNDQKYPEEERFSKCPGWFQTKVIRLFEHGRGFRYDENLSVHEKLTVLLKNDQERVPSCDVTIHHFQYVKGNDRFIFQKQRRYLKIGLKDVEIFSKHALTYFNIGRTLFSLKKNKQAVAYFGKAIKLNPSFSHAYFMLGIVFKEIGSHKKAILSLKKAIEVDSQCADAWTILGMVHDICGREAQAEKILEKAIRMRPLHPLAHNSLGIVYQNQGRWLEAEEEYKKAIEIHCEHPDAYFNLGTLYECMGRFKRSARLYQQALTVRPNDRAAKLRLAAVLRWAESRITF